jgi:mxaJ protein
MPSLCLSCLLLALVTACPLIAKPLRICADPDNLPFSNRAADGFDNRIAALLAKQMEREPVFVWARSRRGFLREEFDKNACDVLMSVPREMRGVATTKPYYRSSYVFVSPDREGTRLASFSDHRLNHHRIGVQILDENMSPPAASLVRYGHARQLVAFESFGKASADIVQAVADGRVSTSVVWGPIAGYYIAKLRLPCTLAPVVPKVDPSGIPFEYSLAVAVHKNDSQLLDALNASLQRLQPQIDHILSTYHVPTLPTEGDRR